MSELRHFEIGGPEQHPLVVHDLDTDEVYWLGKWPCPFCDQQMHHYHGVEQKRCPICGTASLQSCHEITGKDPLA